MIQKNDELILASSSTTISARTGQSLDSHHIPKQPSLTLKAGYGRCTGITKKGQRCKNNAQSLSNGKGYCHAHILTYSVPELKESAPDEYQCHSKTKQGHWCKNSPKYMNSVDGKRYCHMHIHIASSISEDEGSKPDKRTRLEGGDKPRLPGSFVHDGRCHGITRKDKRCGNRVCGGETHCRYHKPFPPELDEWIPVYLSSETRNKLKREMVKKPAMTDEKGFIYAAVVEDSDGFGHYHIKIGRTNTLNRRLSEWDSCGLGNVVGWWPGSIVDKDRAAELPRTRAGVEPGAPGKYPIRLEKLIQLELLDVAHNSLHLKADFLGESKESGANRSDHEHPTWRHRLWPYACGHRHSEIFTIQRVPNGELTVREWEDVVKPMIERWGKFVNEYYN